MGFFRSDQLGVWFMFLLLSPWLSLATDEGYNEADALSAFKSGLKDPQGALENWESPSNPTPCQGSQSQWSHITCDSFGRVIRIDIVKLGLSGQLSGSLGKLKNLQYLVLYQNNLRGKIPAELGDLGNLVTLDLSSNSLTGRIPAELGKLSNLQHLELYLNKFNGHIPAELGNLANLLTLDLSSNYLTGPIPPELGHLLKLNYIHLQNNNLCGYPPQLHPKDVIVRPGNAYMCVPFDCRPCKGRYCCK